MQMQDDAAAVALARDGNEEGFQVLVERHSRHVFRLACRMTGKPEDAEDVVQETFIRAFRQLSRFEARSNFSTWLYRIAYNCAIDFIRARPHREQNEEQETLESMSDVVTSPGADDMAYAGQISNRVQQALEVH